MVESAWAVEVGGLSYAYPDGCRALQGIELRIARGERVALVGANGAGKSTLLLHFNGLMAHPSVRICGLPVTPEHLKTIRQKVGFVFQSPDDQLFCPTVFEDVAFGPRNLKMKPEEVQRRVTGALEKVGLGDSAGRSAHHLSVGQKKRVALATVLSMDPEILVLDEPTSNLDPRGRRELLELLRKLGGTQVVATHNFAFALELCSRVIVMDGGRIVADGAARELLEDPELLAAHGLV
jgi:cobalt/nickel transport system ATP-binding protein